MTSVARREALLDYWSDFYAVGDGDVDQATQLALSRGFERSEVERARETAIEIHLSCDDLAPQRLPA